MQLDAASHSQIDFLAIGHICYDRIPGGRQVGGAAAYTASAAQALGCRAAIVTRSSPQDDWATHLPDLPIHIISSPTTTEFENVYTSNGRVQTIHAIAGQLDASSIPPQWARAPMVYLGPIANEIDPDMVQLFTDSMVGVGPQGWMRRWNDDGCVYAVDWAEAEKILPSVAVAVLSVDDLYDRSKLAEYIRIARILVLTDGANGCTVYFHGEERSFPAPKVDVTDTTGAGDIFATAYLVRLLQTSGDVWDAAVFANWIASTSVTRAGLKAKAAAIRMALGEDYRHLAGHI